MTRSLRMVLPLLLALVGAAHGAEPIAPKRLGILAGTSCPGPEGRPPWKLMLTALERLGWIEGRTIVVDCVSVAGRLAEAPALAEALVKLRPDVLVGASTPTVRALKRATDAIPIVTVASDPVRSGLVRNLARPEGNITGLSPISFELVAKRVELLKELVPRMSRLAIVYRKDADPGDHQQLEKDLTAAAASLGFRWTIFYPADGKDIDELFARLAADGFDAAYVVTNPVTFANRQRLAQLALRWRIPAVSEATEYAREGLLLTYGLNTSRLLEGAAEYIDGLLRGARPADLPLKQSSKFELVVNRASAKALDIVVPQSILFRADEVIE